MGKKSTTNAIQHLTAETAAAFETAVKNGQPVTSKLITQCLAELLRNEDVVADLAMRSLNGENVFRALVRDTIRAEAEQIVLATAHGVLEPAC